MAGAPQEAAAVPEPEPAGVRCGRVPRERRSQRQAHLGGELPFERGDLVQRGPVRGVDA